MGRLGNAAHFQSEVTVPSCGMIFFFPMYSPSSDRAKQSFPYIMTHLCTCLYQLKDKTFHFYLYFYMYVFPDKSAIWFLFKIRRKKENQQWKSGQLVCVWVCMHHVDAVGCVNKIVPVSYCINSDLC